MCDDDIGVRVCSHSMVCVMRVFFAHVFSKHGVCDEGVLCTCVLTAWCV